MNQPVAATKSDLSLIARKNLSLTGIKKIKTTEPNQVVAALDTCTIIISGSNLSVQSASIETGNLEVVGDVSGIRWTAVQKRKWSVKNLFR